MRASGADRPVSSALPWPHEWAMGPRKRELLNTAFVGIIAVGMAWMAWLSLRDGDHEMALVAACLATLCAVLVCGAPFMWVRRRVSARAVVADTASSGEKGVSIQYSRPWFGFLAVLIATLGAICAVTVPVMLMDDLSSQSAFQKMMILLLVVVGLYCGWFVLDVVRGHVMLTPRGVHHRHLVYRDFVPWSSVVAVTAANGPGPVV